MFTPTVRKSALVSVVFFLLPYITLAQSTTTASTTVTIATSTATTTQTAPPVITLPDYKIAANVEAKVRAYFADIPVMIAIAKCESRFRQFDTSGNPLNGGGGGMIGVFQVNGNVHRSFALTLGDDINTVDGNLMYARYLYEREGTNPWIDSFSCWSTATTNPEVTTTPVTTTSTPTTVSPGVVLGATSQTLTANLSFGMIHPEVLLLQKILNTSGFTITTDGPGSPGNETTKFGSLTRDAIRRFQCAKGLVCAGDEGSTGYGYVGARTRAALIAASPSTINGTQNTNSSNQSNAQVTPPLAQPTTQAANDKAEKIKSLEAQVTQYLKLISDLQAQINSLKN